MTAPMTGLDWQPSRDALTIAAEWGIGEPYTIYWGDGTNTPVPGQARGGHREPHVHTYAGPGAYDVVALTPDGKTASAQVVVRAWAKPPEPGSALEGNRVTLTFPTVAEPVHWLVDWGHGGATSTSTGGPVEHTYPWNSGAATITVTDVPSKRKVTFTGPSIGAQPKPPTPEFPAVSGVLWTYDSGRTFHLIGGELDPGTTVEWWGIASAKTFSTPVTDQGTAFEPFTTSHPSDPDRDQWRTYVVRYWQGGVRHTRLLPLHVPSAREKTPQVTYEFGHITDTTPAGDPFTITFSVTEHQKGRHHIDFGDGSVALVNLTKGPLQVTHAYPRSTPRMPYQVTITLPDGRATPVRHVGPHTCVGPIEWSTELRRPELIWCRSSTPTCVPPDQFAPIVLEWLSGHTGRLQQLHNPTTRNKCWLGAYSFSLPAGTTVRYRLHRPLFEPHDDSLTTPSGARADTDPDVIELVDRGQGETDAAVTAKFGQVTEWDGGYKGQFHVTNHTTREVDRWHVDFALDDPAVLRDAWPDAEISDRGAGRWRISSNTPIPAGTAVTVTARVEPPGRPRMFPDEIHAGAG